MRGLFHKYKNPQRGSALALVLIFMTAVLMLGTALLVSAQSEIGQTAAVLKTETQYYAAEAAAQLATQMFVTEMNSASSGNLLGINERTLEPGEDADNLIKGYAGDVENKIKKIYENVCASISESYSNMFNGEEVVFLPLEYDLNKEMIPYATDSSKTVEFPMHNPKFSITAMSGGRKATINTPSKVELDIYAKVTADSIFQESNGGAYYVDNSGNAQTDKIYGNTDGSSTDEMEQKETYEKLIDGLEKLVEQTNAIEKKSILKYEERIVTSAEGEIVYEWADPHPWTVTSAGGNPILSGSTEYAQVNGNITLKGDYPNLRFLDITGNLTISGDVNCPLLEGVYVGGGVTVNSNASIHKMTMVSNKVTDENRPDSGVIDFLVVGGDVKINCAAEINWCRFNVVGQSINFDFSGNVSLTSNSIFTATKNSGGGKGQISGTGQNFRALTHGAVPQFYSEGDLKLNIQNGNASFVGIFMTLSDAVIFNNTACNLQGLFVGNCGNNQTKGVTPFATENIDLLLEGGLFHLLANEANQTVIPGVSTLKIVYRIDFGNLGLSENAGS